MAYPGQKSMCTCKSNNYGVYSRPAKLYSSTRMKMEAWKSLAGFVTWTSGLSLCQGNEQTGNQESQAKRWNISFVKEVSDIMDCIL